MLLPGLKVFRLKQLLQCAAKLSGFRTACLGIIAAAQVFVSGLIYSMG